LRIPRLLPLGIALVSLTVAGSLLSPAHAFTQSGGTWGNYGSKSPMGHEWLTRRAAIELLLGTDPKVANDPKDPRLTWKTNPELAKGLARNLDISGSGAQAEVTRIKGQKNSESRYASTYEAVFDAIIGERWVDIAGMNLIGSKFGAHNCFDTAAQEPAEVQYDHFMRRYDDVDEHGGVDAAKGSQQRFIEYFVAAAMAPRTQMLVWDGGASGVTKYTVDRNYFLMGRAAHLLQDSFSLEHTVRIPDDNYSKLRQVKGYICPFGSEQHTHLNPWDYDSGDVIWVKSASWYPGWSSYKPSAMRINALVAMEASKDLWAAFIRTMGTPSSEREAKAKAEAQTLVNNWMHFDENEMMSWYADTKNRGPTYVLEQKASGSEQAQNTCIAALGKPQKTQAELVAFLKSEQTTCLYNVEAVPGYDDLWDPSLNMPFYWKWKTGVLSKYLTPPSGWKPSPHPADSGVRVNILAAAKETKAITVKSLAANTYVKLSNNEPLDLILVGDPKTGAYLRAAQAPTLFLSYTAGSSGQVKLWNGTTDSQYVFEDAGDGKAIMNTRWKQYMWYDDDGAVHVTKDGKASKSNAQWKISELK